MIRTFFFLLLLITAQGADLSGLEDAGGKTRVSLLLPVDAVQPGQTFFAAIRFELRKGWHTYWRYPGESGAPPSLNWKLPTGFSVGEILWPVPEKLTEEGIVTYIYNQEMVLLAPITVSNTVAHGAATLQVGVDWIECKTACVSAQTEISATVSVRDRSSVASATAGLFEEWQKRLPLKDLPFSVFSEIRGDGDKATLRIVMTNQTAQAEFFPYSSDQFEVAHATDTTTQADGSLQLNKAILLKDKRWPESIEGLLVIKTPNSSQGYGIRLNLAATTPADLARRQDQRSFWGMLVYAFIGGLILNAMPCVLPVIALKILGFIGQNKTTPARTRMLGLVYGSGVIVTFAALAAMAILVQQAGHRVGWGMQFGNPQFLVVLTVLVTLVACNLFGLFEVTLGGRTMEAAGGLASKEGVPGAFFNGMLAVALATPCTAPYLGAALGFAFLQSAPVILAIFIAAGMGLASPYVLLSWNPGWLKYLPKPGFWMEKLKIAFGFPMLATAVWLFMLAANHYGKHALWLALFLVVLAMSSWIFGEFFQKGRQRRGLAFAGAVLLAVVGYAYAMEMQLRWRHATPAEAVPDGRSNPEGIPWQPWSAARVEQARSQGRPVLVDFTADWCLTCQVNKKTSIDIASVKEKLQSLNAVALLGDYTRTPDAITIELNRFQRAGVPLVLVYPKDASKPPLVLPELLTPQVVLNALDEAAR